MIKKRFLIAALLLLAGQFFSACSNDLDVLDDYKEIPVVYSLINPTVSTNYVRVQRAFLGAGNALLMAQNPDSMYYDTTAIDVKIVSYRNKTVLDTFQLTPTTQIPKNEGLFTDLDHILYKLDNTVIDPSLQYEFLFTNKTTGKIVTASTKIVNPITIQNYSVNGTFPKINLAAVQPYHVSFSSCKNGKLYGMIFRFRYTETNKISLVTTNKYVDYYLDQQTSLTTVGGVAMEFLLDGSKIFKYIGSQIKDDANVTRSSSGLSCDFLFSIGSEDLNNYIEVNAPSNTVNYIPNFTNLSDGKGIFTSRLDTAITGIRYNDVTLDSLLNGQYTHHIFAN